MRLLHVVTAWPRDADDVITPWLVALGERLAARGHEIDVLAPAYRGERGGEANGMTVRRFRYAPARWERLLRSRRLPQAKRQAAMNPPLQHRRRPNPSSTPGQTLKP